MVNHESGYCMGRDGSKTFCLLVTVHESALHQHNVGVFIPAKYDESFGHNTYSCQPGPHQF